MLIRFNQTPNGLRYLRVGGRGFCLGAGKTRSHKNAYKSRRIPHVRCTLCWQELGLKHTPPKNQHHAFDWLDFTRATIFYKPDFAIETETDLLKRQSRELAITFATNWLSEKFTLPEKINLAKKPEPNLPKLLLKPWSRFWSPDLTKENASQKKRTLQNETACLPKLYLKTLKPILETGANLTRNFLNQNHEPIFEKQKLGKLPPLKIPEFIEYNFC